MNEVNELLGQRAKCIADAKAIAGAAHDAGREMTAEEEQQFDRLHDRAAELHTQAEAAGKRRQANEAREARQREAEASLRASRGRLVTAGQPGATPGAQARGGDGAAGLEFRGRTLRLPPGSAVARRSTAEYRAAFSSYIRGEPVHLGYGADLQTDIAEKGGYLAPPEFTSEVLKVLDNTFWFRKLARVLPPTTAPSVTFPRRTSRMNLFTWGSELSPPVADVNAAILSGGVTGSTNQASGLAFGKFTLEPHYMTGRIDVSNDLLAAGIVDVDAFVTDEIGYAGGQTEEYAFFLGDGVRKPVGIFTPTKLGISTARDVTGSIDATNANAQNTLLDIKFSLREPYLRSDSLRWVAHRNWLRVVSKVKSTQNEPIFLPSVREGVPDLVLGVPLVLSEYAPAGTGAGGTYQTGDYGAVIGDFRNYFILDSMDMGVQRLVEIGALNNQTVYLVRRKVDGCPVHEEAFARHVFA